MNFCSISHSAGRYLSLGVKRARTVDLMVATTIARLRISGSRTLLERPSVLRNR